MGVSITKHKLLMLVVIGSVVLLSVLLVSFVNQETSEKPIWYCDKIDCGDLQFSNVTFDGSPLYWKLRNCRVINCKRIE